MNYRSVKLLLAFFVFINLSVSVLYADDNDKSESDNLEKVKLKVIVISKEEMDMKVYDVDGNIAMQFPIACGLNYGNKKKRGDKKTPEGTFKITEINDASNWSHDFKDGKGIIPKAYGAHFVRLNVPGNRSIGIHGTHAPESIGTRATEGCIRLNNTHLDSLVAVLDKTETVVILPSIKGILSDQNVEISSYSDRLMALNRKLIQPIILPQLYTVFPRKKVELDTLN